jgi:hypothetical protein
MNAAALPLPTQDPRRAIVDFIGRHGVVTINHVIDALRLSRRTAYRHTAACLEDRLLARQELLSSEPSLLCATSRGLRYAGLRLRPAKVSLSSVDHRLRSASLAQLLSEEFSSDQILSERELIHAERLAGGPRFSSLLPNNRLHRPDLAIQTPTQTIAIELELSAKSPQRLASILSAWTEATWISEVRYYVKPGIARRAVERALANTNSSHLIRLFDAPFRNP